MSTVLPESAVAPAPRPGGRRVGAVVCVLGTVIALASAVSLPLLSKAETVTDLVRPELTDRGLEQHRADFETARDLATGVENDVLPALATALDLTPDELKAQITGSFPAVAALLERDDDITTFAQATLRNLEKRQHQFERADALPLGSLPITAGGWFGLVAGLVVLLCGAVVLHGSGRRRTTALVVAGVTGLALVVFPLAAEVPSKTAAAAAVLDSLDPSQAAVDRTVQARATVGDGFTEFEDRLVPAIAQSLSSTPEQLRAAVDQQFPEVAADLDALPAVLARYDARIHIRVAGAPSLRTLTRLPVAAMAWTIPVLGLAVVVAALTGGRRRESVNARMS